MIRLENMTPATNLGLQPSLVLNEWVITNTLMFNIIATQGRARVSVAPKSISFKQVRPRRMLAEAVRCALKNFRANGSLPVSRAQVDAAFVQTLRSQGCSKLFCGYQAAKLILFGTLTRAYWYWAVPKAPEQPTKGVPDEQKDS